MLLSENWIASWQLNVQKKFQPRVNLYCRILQGSLSKTAKLWAREAASAIVHAPTAHLQYILNIVAPFLSSNRAIREQDISLQNITFPPHFSNTTSLFLYIYPPPAPLCQRPAMWNTARRQRLWRQLHLFNTKKRFPRHLIMHQRQPEKRAVVNKILLYFLNISLYAICRILSHFYLTKICA